MEAAMEGFDGRLVWRRSRWLPTGLCLLAIAAIAATWLSDLPQVACIVTSAVVTAYAGWLLHRESKRPDCILTHSGDATEWRVECLGRAETLRHVAASFRGGLVVLTLADSGGKLRRYVWWPDTLDARGRRALRLATRDGAPDAKLAG
jgi:toxin CptA